MTSGGALPCIFFDASMFWTRVLRARRLTQLALLENAHQNRGRDGVTRSRVEVVSRGVPLVLTYLAAARAAAESKKTPWYTRA